MVGLVEGAGLLWCVLVLKNGSWLQQDLKGSSLNPPLPQLSHSKNTSETAGDATAAARHLLRWTKHQTCPDPVAFARDMARLFAAHADVYSQQGVDLDSVLQGVLRLARRHEVSIDSCYASLVISVCVITVSRVLRSGVCADYWCVDYWVRTGVWDWRGLAGSQVPFFVR